MARSVWLPTKNGTISFRHLSKSVTTYLQVKRSTFFTILLAEKLSDPADDHKYNVNPSIINRRGIYKDVFGSGAGREWSDYQFRCNFPIAMTVAPELFNEEHALGALKLADKVLRGPLGMATLDPADMQYRPYYDNANDGTDAAIAKGLNYHNVRCAYCCYLMGVV